MPSSIDRRDAVLGGILVVMMVVITLRAPVFLSAGSDDVARVYERVGFRRIGSAGSVGEAS